MLLTSYELARKQVERGELLERINDHDDPMPEDGLMPKHMRRLFAIWAETGFIDRGKEKPVRRSEYQEFSPPEITPVDVSREGFELLEALQGHWVGPMTLMGQKYDWMAFDYRAIAPSHVHGIFEAGTIGNLFTSFFVTEFKGRKTIMARNGGVLNGIYRTSYFVLTDVRKTWRGTRYKLVDAFGGDGIMWMELTFSGDRLEFNSYTSRLGLTAPKRHMAFNAQRKRPELAVAAARSVGFPRNVVDFSMPDPMPVPTWVSEYPQTSQTYIAHDEGRGLSLVQLGTEAQDPRLASQMPHLSTLSVSIERNAFTAGKPLHIYLSQKAITDSSGKLITRGGYVREELIDTLLLYPELNGRTDSFTFTYLHPGDYFLTVVADMDTDGYPSPGDITHPATRISVRPETRESVTVDNLNVRN